MGMRREGGSPFIAPSIHSIMHSFSPLPPLPPNTSTSYFHSLEPSFCYYFYYYCYLAGSSERWVMVLSDCLTQLDQRRSFLSGHCLFPTFGHVQPERKLGFPNTLRGVGAKIFFLSSAVSTDSLQLQTWSTVKNES